MKYTVHGFSQKVAIELNLNNDDLLLLRWMVDFVASNKMKKKIIDENIYYWVDYGYVCQEMPIISDKVDTIYRKFNGLIKSNVLLRHTRKDKSGTYSYFAFGDEYDSLISSTLLDKKQEEPSNYDSLEELGKKSELVDSDSEKNPSESGGTRKKIRTKDSSITSTYSSITKSVIQSKEKTDGQTDDSMNESQIKNQIGYLSLIKAYSEPFIDEIVSNILDMYYSTNIKVKGDIKPQTIVRSILSKLTYWHISYINDSYQKVTTPIKNKKEYIQTMIYNSVLEMDASNINEYKSYQEG